MLAQQPEQQMLAADVAMAEHICLLGTRDEHSLAFVTQGQVHRSRHALANDRVGIDLLANGFVRVWRQQSHNFAILPEESEQQMLSLNARRSVSTRFVTRKENDAAGFLGVSLEHRNNSKATILRLFHLQ